MKKTKAEIIEDIEFLSRMLADQFTLPLKVKGQDAQIANILTRLERVEATQARILKRLSRGRK